MNTDLLKIFNGFVNIMKMAEGVLGAWNFDPALHGMSDHNIFIPFPHDSKIFNPQELF